MSYVRIIVAAFCIAVLFCIYPSIVVADGTLSNVGASVGSLAGSDAVSWANANPIMIDAYGHYIVPTENNAGNYYFTYSNDKGTSWSSATISSLVTRPTAVYDSANDKIHVLIEESGKVEYRRYSIKRNSTFNISGFIEDTTLTAMNFEAAGSCTVSEGGTYPMLFWKDNGANGILVAFWEVKKTCSGTTVYETRTSMRTLTNSSADGTVSNWAPIDGHDDSGTAVGPALVPFTTLYSASSTGTGRKLEHAALIRGGTGSRANDIYYFNIDENVKWGFQRFSWNSTSSNWSGTTTSRSIFTGDVNGSGYTQNDEIITKPAYDSVHDRVYIGVPQWRGSTLKDSQTLYYVDSSDAVNEVGDVYNHKNGTFFAPTMDIMFNSDDNKLYVFYQTSSTDPTNPANATSTSFEGNAWYRTYDGSTLGTPTAYMSQSIGGTQYTIDIPIVYKDPDNGKIILYHRMDGSETPYFPPHYVFFGYLSSGGTATVNAVSATSPYSATTLTDFDKYCATLTNAQAINDSGGEIGLASTFRDDFEVYPQFPYLFNDKWTTGVWSGGSVYYPTVDGTLLVRDTNGAYAYGSTTMTNKILEFRAKFTAHNFQHIGFTDTNAFNKYIMFSTGSNASLHTRQNDSGEVGTDLGTSYLGSFHKYKIDWGTTSVRYYIDDVLVDTQTTQITSTALNAIISNNTTTAGSDLTADWIRVINFPSTTGSYLSCPISSGISNAVWGTINYTSTLPVSTSLTVKTRTSSDGATWSAYSSALSSGDTITSAAGKFIQYLVNFSGTASTTPTLDNISIAFSSPTPVPTAAPSATTGSSSGNASSSNNAATCTDVKPEVTPNLYAASSSGTDSIKLYFADDSNTVTSYAIEYGTESGKYLYSANNSGSKGTRQYTVKSLQKNTKYYFRVRNGNGCTPGNWSSEISAKTNDATNNINVVNVTPQFSIAPVTEPSPSPRATAAPTNQWTEKKEMQGYDVTIKVVDEKKNPVKDAKVTLHSTPRTAYTDSSGIAHFTGIERGAHTVQIAYNNYQGEQQISLAGEVKEFSINIEIKKNDSLMSKLGWGLSGFAIALISFFSIRLILHKRRLSQS